MNENQPPNTNAIPRWSGPRSTSVSVSYVQARSLKRDLLAEQQASWQQGKPVTPEELLPRWPTDPREDRDFASFLFEDYQQRWQQGEKPSLDEYNQRFPEHKDSLAHLLSHHEVLKSLKTGSGSNGLRLGLPEVGDEVFGFRLRGELGSGAFARVFLAGQANLADRPVVLKVSGIDGDEPYNLAQLQHTNVVPIYSVHEDLRAGLRALCMPYFGGASLSSVLRPLWEKPASPPAHGSQLVKSLQAVGAPALEDLQRPPAASGGAGAPGNNAATDRETPLKILAGMSYIQATAWIVARLAEGLHHAHQRGVLHRDIKPSNILLGADGQPMLLDFNLAQNLQRQDRAEATLGGTVAYMAPEHLRALANPDPDTARQVDHRSDVYSLGMVLFEMLTGHSPFDQSASYSVLPVMIEAMALERSQAAPSVRKRQPTVPWGLESILRKCLAPDPAHRYQRAEELAEDLRRFLDDRPLKHAPELSQVERARKWVRRHPRLTSSGVVVTAASVLLMTAGAALVGVHQHLAAAEQRLGEQEARERLQAYEAGTLQTLCLINTVTPMEDHLPLGLRECEKTLALYGILDRDDWQAQPAWQHLAAEDRQRLAETTQELLLLLAWGRVRSAGKDAAVLRQALDLLGRAEAIDGLKPSKALWMDRAAYLQQVGDDAGAEEAKEKAQRIEPSSTRDHYLLATTYGRQHNLGRALDELKIALELNPKHYWSWNQRGICYQEQGDYVLAVGAFSTCIGLQPDLPWGHFNQGYALQQSGKKAEAIDAYSRALRCDPHYLPAYFNRGLAYLDLKHHAEALRDFDEARRLGRRDAHLHAGRGMALEGLGRHAEADAAFDLAFTPAQDGKPAPLPMRLGYAFTVSERLPARAREAFEDVLRQQPRCLEALYGLAMLESKQGRVDEAIRYFDRAIEANCLYLDALRYRAVLLARRGRFEPAKTDINLCLAQDPQGGSTLYAAACVLAHMARHYRDPQVANQALDFLEQAFQRGYGRELFAKDPDLAGLRNHPDFQDLLTKHAPPAAAPSH